MLNLFFNGWLHHHKEAIINLNHLKSPNGKEDITFLREKLKDYYDSHRHSTLKNGTDNQEKHEKKTRQINERINKMSDAVVRKKVNKLIHDGKISISPSPTPTH